MIVSTAILALLLSRQTQTTTQDPRAFQIGPKLVKLHFPNVNQDAVPEPAVANWSGWSGISGPVPTFPEPYVGTGDWSEVDKSFPGAIAPGTISWRVKVVILANVDCLITHANGVQEDRRNSLTGPRFIETLDAIPQFVALVSERTGGKVRVVPDVLIDPEPSRDLSRGGHGNFDRDYLTRYLQSRINGGTYDADDKLFRGPYHSVVFIDPCMRNSSPDQGLQPRTVSDVFRIAETPAANVAFDCAGGGQAPGNLAIALFDAWTATVSNRAIDFGLPSLSGSLKELDWAELARTDTLPTDLLLKRLATHPNRSVNQIELPAHLLKPAFKTSNVGLAVVKDPQKGEVLEYTESTISRSGGFALPYDQKAIDLAKAHIFSFSYKTACDRTVGMAFVDSTGKTHWFSLGRDPETVDSGPAAELSVPLLNDQAWHTVNIDLNALSSSPIVQVRLGATPHARELTSDLAIPIKYDLADFKLGSDPATSPLAPSSADPSANDSESRSMAAIGLIKGGQPAAALAKLLNDPDDGVVLNALFALNTISDSALEQRLTELSMSAAPRISEFALRALDHLGTQTAKDAINRALRSGFEYSREIAAGLIASKNDPKSADDLAVLLAGQMWHTRLASVHSLAQVSGKTSAILRLAMLQQDDPIIKLEVVLNTDPQDETDLRKLLWSAVNEPSDLVRATSYAKLISSTVNGMKSEGLKGVRDDSWWTRTLVLRFLEQNPSELARGPIRLALTDREPRVRAAALNAMSALEKVTLEDLQSCLADPHPLVDVALVNCSKKHTIDLPPATVEMLKRRPDIAVVNAMGR